MEGRRHNTPEEDLEIYNEMNALLTSRGRREKVGEILELVKNVYGFATTKSLYDIRNRVEKRLKDGYYD